MQTLRVFLCLEHVHIHRANEKDPKVSTHPVWRLFSEPANLLVNLDRDGQKKPHLRFGLPGRYKMLMY